MPMIRTDTHIWTPSLTYSMSLGTHSFKIYVRNRKLPGPYTLHLAISVGYRAGEP